MSPMPSELEAALCESAVMEVLEQLLVAINCY